MNMDIIYRSLSGIKKLRVKSIRCRAITICLPTATIMMITVVPKYVFLPAIVTQFATRVLLAQDQLSPILVRQYPTSLPLALPPLFRQVV